MISKYFLKYISKSIFHSDKLGKLLKKKDFHYKILNLSKTKNKVYNNKITIKSIKFIKIMSNKNKINNNP